MKPGLILVAGLWAGSLAASYFAGKAAGLPETIGGERKQQTLARNGVSRESAGPEGANGLQPVHGAAADLLPEALPAGEEEIKAWKDRIAESLGASLSASERMLLVTRILSGMTPENAWLIKDAFGQSWDSGCHFHAEHDLMWNRLGEVLKANAANQLIRPEGPFWPVHGKLLEGWARSDPSGIAQWLTAIPDHTQRRHIITAALRGLAASSPGTSLDLVLGLPEAERTEALVAAESGAGNLGGAPGASRLRDAIAGLPGEEFRQVFTAAAKDNPLQAVSWAEAFARQHPQRSQEAYDTIAGAWMAADSLSMSEWLNSIQNHPGSDAMTLRMVKQIAADDPEAALAWANKITEPGLRSEALGRLKK